MRLLPRDAKFFDLFSTVVEISVESPNSSSSCSRPTKSGAGAIGRITRLRPFGGFNAETGGGITVLLATGLGVPVSTTHTITGAIVGVGASQRLSAVRWGVAKRIVWAWILTLPMSAAIAALSYLVLSRMT
jgi:hypothetical protein